MDIFTFEINGDYFGIPIENVDLIEGRWDTVTGETGTPSYIKEIIVLHGMTVPIYDLASQFGYVEQKIEYVVILNIKGAKIGLAISGASKIITVDESAIHPIPAVLNTAQHFVKSTVCHQENLISLINVNRLIPADTECPGGTEHGI